MKRDVVMHLATAFCMCTASSAHAHHSHGLIYDLCKSVTIEGRIETVQWKDPHIWIDLKMDDGTTYHAEWTSLRGLANNGVAAPQEALRFGARVVITGHPSRDPALIRATYPSFKNDSDPRIVDPTQIRRSDDSWSWAQPNATPPECGRK
jgi:Family of unknown function (DUF6152)